MSADQKTLGQIAFEAFYGDGPEHAWMWVEDWENAAKAVQAEDRKRLVKKLEDSVRSINKLTDAGLRSGIKHTIRILKEEM